MQKVNVLKQKSFEFGKRVVKLRKYLVSEFKEYDLSRQLLRSGTGVGAIIREAEFAQSRKDFLNKLSIAAKEANESIYWVELLYHCSYLTKEMFLSIHQDAREILAILVASIRTVKSKENL